MEYTLNATAKGGLVLSSSYGFLHCPYQQETIRCGTWCALFRVKTYNNENTTQKVVEQKCCNSKIYLGLEAKNEETS